VIYLAVFCFVADVLSDTINKYKQVFLNAKVQVRRTETFYKGNILGN